VIIVGLLGLAIGFGLGRLGGGATVDGGAGQSSFDQAQMEQAVAETLKVVNSLERADRLIDLMADLDEQNVQGAGAAFNDQIGTVDQLDARIFLGAWSAFDPRAAADYVLEWKRPSMRAYGAGEVFYNWAASGGAIEARHYLIEVKEGKVHHFAFERLLDGWLRSGESTGATELFSDLEDGDKRDRLTQTFVTAMLATDGVDAVVAWAESVPDDAPNRFKGTAFRKAIRQVSIQDPQRAASWYDEHDGQPWAVRTMAVVTSEWVETDPIAAYEWVSAKSPSRIRGLAMARLINRWMRTDPDRAYAWMLALEYEPSMSPMVLPFVQRYSQVDAAEAAKWIDRIPDEKQREQAIQVVARAYGLQDEESAQAWIEGLDLTEPERTRLSQIASSGPAPPPPGLPNIRQMGGAVVVE
jgi:hypothetical protein